MMNSEWNINFYRQSPLFSPIVSAYLNLSTCKSRWPDLNEYQQLLNQCPHPVTNHLKNAIQVVPQLDTADDFTNQYEPMIYCKAQLQTRQESWHDFFQVLAWYCFPTTKARLNALHFNAAKKRYQLNPENKQRSKLENFLTLFDECGTIVVSSSDSLLELIRDFKWKELFIKNRSEFSRQIECVVFGHAMYEKAISPYIGMTAQCLLLKQPNSFFSLSQEEKNAVIDEEISEMLWQHKEWTTKALQPLPILGVPGWHQDNGDDSFYDNENYFRQKPRSIESR